jgi:hypothetical protein
MKEGVVNFIPYPFAVQYCMEICKVFRIITTESESARGKGVSLQFLKVVWLQIDKPSPRLLKFDKFAFEPWATISNFLSAVVTYFFAPDSTVLLFHVPGQFLPPLLEGESAYCPAEGLLNALTEG